MEKVVQLIEKKVDLNEKEAQNGATALHWAIRMKRFDIANYLIDKGAEIKIKNKENRTPLDLLEKKDLEKILSIVE